MLVICRITVNKIKLKYEKQLTKYYGSLASCTAAGFVSFRCCGLNLGGVHTWLIIISSILSFESKRRGTIVAIIRRVTEQQEVGSVDLDQFCALLRRQGRHLLDDKTGCVSVRRMEVKERDVSQSDLVQNVFGIFLYRLEVTDEVVVYPTRSALFVEGHPVAVERILRPLVGQKSHELLERGRPLATSRSTVSSSYDSHNPLERLRISASRKKLES